MDQLAAQSVVACIVNSRARSNNAERLSDRVAELFREHGTRAETVVVDHGSDSSPSPGGTRRAAAAPSLPPVATAR